MWIELDVSPQVMAFITITIMIVSAIKAVVKCNNKSNKKKGK